MGNLQQYWYSFDDGCKAGEAILRLIAQINPELKAACDSMLSEEELKGLIERFRSVSKAREPMPCVEGLLSKLVKPNELESNLITLWGIDEFWDNQSNYAPICEVSPELGFVQLGSWTGDCDGDAWVIDTESARIASLSLNLLDYNADTVRSYCYEIFNSPWQWFSFLRCLGWEREWLSEN